MVTVQHLVRKMVDQRPFVAEALSQGIINNAALAEQLLPYIEKELRKKVTFAAVNMAVRRIAESLGNIPFGKPRFEKDADITLKSNLAEITLFRMDDVQQPLRKLYDIVDMKRGDFLTITQGLHEVTLFINMRQINAMLKIFPARSVKKVVKGLVSLSMTIPPQAINTIGYFFVVTRALVYENINIVDIVSTYTEMIIIVREEDATRSYECLRSVVAMFS